MKKSRVVLIASLVAAALLAMGLAGCGAADDSITVNVKVDAHVAADAGADVSAAAFDAAVQIPKEGNVYDALVATGLDIEGTAEYITAIGGLQPGLAGAMSGWCYTVNDIDPDNIMDAARDYILQDGDTVTWLYRIWEF